MRSLLLLPLCLFSGFLAIFCHVGTLQDNYVSGHTYCGSAFNIVTNEAVFKGVNVLDYYAMEGQSYSREYTCKFVKDKTDHMYYVNCLCQEDECNKPRRPSEVAKKGFKMQYWRMLKEN